MITETYVITSLVLFVFIISILFLSSLTGGRIKNIYKSDFWVMFGISFIITLLFFILLIKNIIPIESIINNSIIKSLFSIK